MPTVAEHLETARRNHGVSNFLLDNKSEYTEWEAICLFYSAVHLLEAYLASMPVPYHPGSQSERSSSVARYFSKECFKKYALLKDKSIEARYNCKLYSEEYVRSTIVPAFEFFERRVTDRLGRSV